MRLTRQGASPSKRIFINKFWNNKKKKLATLFLCCLTSKVLWIFNCCYFRHVRQVRVTQTLQGGRSQLNTPLIVTLSFPINFIQFPTRSLGNKGQKILQAQKIHKKEKETTSIVATHLLTFRFTRNQYSPNISAKTQKNNASRAAEHGDFFITSRRYKTNTFPLPPCLFWKIFVQEEQKLISRKFAEER